MSGTEVQGAGPRIAATCSERPRGWALGLALVVLVATAASVAFGPVAGPSAEASGPGDLAMYRAMVERIGAGEAYYTVVGSELRERGYPRRPVFNWRTPLHLSLLAALGSPAAGRWLFGGLVLLNLVLAVRWLRPGPGRWVEAAACGLFALGMVNGLLGELALFAELWAGALLATAALAYANGWPIAGVAAALLALFFRELAAVPCVVLTAVALAERRWKEVGLWAVGAVAYGVYFALHAAAVEAHLLPVDEGSVKSWLGLGGPAFWIASLRFHGAFVLLPTAALVVVPAVVGLGLIEWRDPRARALRTVVASVALFVLVFGLPSNAYWGKLALPLLAFPFTAGLLVLGRWLRRLSRRGAPPPAP